MSNAAMSPISSSELFLNSGQKGGLQSKDNSPRSVKEDGGNDLYDSFNSSPEELRYNNPFSHIPQTTPHLTLVDDNSNSTDITPKHTPVSNKSISPVTTPKDTTLSNKSKSSIIDTIKDITGIKKFGAKAIAHRYEKYGLHTFPNSAEKDSFKKNGYSLTPKKNGNDDGNLHHCLESNTSNGSQHSPFSPGLLSSVASRSENTDVINTDRRAMQSLRNRAVIVNETNQDAQSRSTSADDIDEQRNQYNPPILSPVRQLETIPEHGSIETDSQADSNHRDDGIDNLLLSPASRADSFGENVENSQSLAQRFQDSANEFFDSNYASNLNPFISFNRDSSINSTNAQNPYDYRTHGFDSCLFDEVHSEPKSISETDQRELIEGIVSVTVHEENLVLYLFNLDNCINSLYECLPTQPLFDRIKDKNDRIVQDNQTVLDAEIYDIYGSDPIINYDNPLYQISEHISKPSNMIADTASVIESSKPISNNPDYCSQCVFDINHFLRSVYKDTEYCWKSVVHFNTRSVIDLKLSYY